MENTTRWRGIQGQTYYYINSAMRVVEAFERNQENDDARWRVKNYFKSREEAYDKADIMIDALKRKED